MPGSAKDKKDKGSENKDRVDRRESKAPRELAKDTKVAKQPGEEAAGKSNGIEEKFEKCQDEMRASFKKLDDSMDRKIGK